MDKIPMSGGRDILLEAGSEGEIGANGAMDFLVVMYDLSGKISRCPIK